MHWASLWPRCEELWALGREGMEFRAGQRLQGGEWPWLWSLRCSMCERVNSHPPQVGVYAPGAATASAPRVAIYTCTMGSVHSHWSVRSHRSLVKVCAWQETAQAPLFEPE